jgi:hypothetical protein
MPTDETDAPYSPFSPLTELLAGLRRPGDFCAAGTVVTPIPCGS